MEPVLVYTDGNGVEVGALQTFSLDMAFGADEQDFELTFRDSPLTGGEYVYIDGTEYGGVIDQVTYNTLDATARHVGRTWHGILAGKVVKPPSGQDYYTVAGEANQALADLVGYVGMSGLFAASSTASGITVNYQAERFDNCYDVMLKALGSAGALLRMRHVGGKVEIWAEPATIVSDEADSDLMQFEVTKAHRVPNHLVCAGEGQLQERVVVDLYADADGNVSQTQSLFGVDEITLLYTYNGADRDKLIEEGTKKLKGYQTEGGADVNEVGRGDWYVGTVLRVRDNRTGTVVTASIAKKIVKIERGVLTVDYEIGDEIAAKAASWSTDTGGFAESVPCLPLTGGTLTGNLYVQDHNATIQQTDADTTQADNGVSANTYRYFSVIDSQDHYMSWAGAQVYTNGNVDSVLGARNYGTGSAVSNTLVLRVLNDGSRVVTLSSEPWREALGLSTGVQNANGSSVNCSNNTGTNLLSISLTAGTWLVMCGVNWSSNTSGVRYIHFTSTSKSTNDERCHAIRQNATTTGQTTMALMAMTTHSATTTYYLVGLQNSGSTLSAIAYMRAFRIA